MTEVRRLELRRPPISPTSTSPPTASGRIDNSSSCVGTEPATPVARSTAPRSMPPLPTGSAMRSSGSRPIRAGTASQRTCSCFPWGSSSAGSSPPQLRTSPPALFPVASSSTATAAERATRRPRRRPSVRCGRPRRSRMLRICASPRSMAPAFGSERGTGRSTSHSSRRSSALQCLRAAGRAREPEGVQRADSLIRPLLTDVDGTRRR